jgi:hypothetical protein
MSLNSVVPATPGLTKSDWISLGRGIAIRYTRGDFRYAQGGRAYSFKVRNQNLKAVHFEVEVTLINEEGERTRAIEYFAADPGIEAGDGGNWTVARDMVSFRMKDLQLVE